MTSDESTVELEIEQVNNPPTVNITIPTTVQSGATVEFVADPNDIDGDDTTVMWTAPQGSFSPNDAETTDYTAPVVTVETTVLITCTVSDGTDSGFDTATITVTPSATIPSRVSRPTATAVSGSNTEILVDWNIPSSDGGSDITRYDVRYRASGNLTYTTVQVTESGGVIPTQVTLTGLTAARLYRIQVRAVNAINDNPDNWSLAATETTNGAIPTVVIRVAGNEGPINVPQLSTVILVADATSTTSGGITSYSWSGDTEQFDDDLFLDDDTRRAWVAPATSGTFTVSITVRDSIGSATDSIQLVVSNSPPVITSVTELGKVTRGSSHILSVVATDSDPGDQSSLTYSWSAGTVISGSGGRRINWVAPQTPGTHDITVTVTDPEGLQATRTTGYAVNAPPTVVLSADDTTLDANESTIIRALITDDDDNLSDLTQRWAVVRGNFVTIETLDSEGRYAREYEAPNRKGTVNISIIVSDGLDVASDSIQLTINNQAPEPTISPPSVSLETGENQPFTAIPNDPDGDLCTYSWSLSGVGRLSGTTGQTVTYFAPSSGSGTATLTVTATDNDASNPLSGISAAATITVTEPAAQPPIIDTFTVSSTSARPSDTIVMMITGRNFDQGNSNHVRWESDAEGIFGNIFNNDLRFQRFTLPSGRGIITITVTVSNDDTNVTDSESVDITILNVAPDAGVIMGLGNTITVGKRQTARVSATDDNDDPLTYQWTSERLMRIGRTNQTAQVIEAPSRTSESTAIGTLNCTVTDEPLDIDDSISDTATTTIIIVPTRPSPPVIGSVGLITTGSIEVNWTAPSNDGGADLTGYDIRLRVGSTSSGTIQESVSDLPPDRTSYEFTNLLPGTTYRFEIETSNAFLVGSAQYGFSSIVAGQTYVTMPSVVINNAPVLTRGSDAIITLEREESIVLFADYFDSDGDIVTAGWTFVGDGSLEVLDSGGLFAAGRTSARFTAPNHVSANVVAVSCSDEHGLAGNVLVFFLRVES